LDTGGILAVKEIRFQDSQSIQQIVPTIKDEMTVLEMLNHPNIVQYYGVEIHRDKVNIFMEYCEGGSLASLLEHGRIEDELVIQVYTLQMFEGLAYLHDMKIVHRDIKPENILLDHNGIIKFVDFGAAKVAKNLTMKPATKVNSMTGTPMYMSPEVITGGKSSRFGAIDIWSTGCCVLEMATGRRPWANLDNEWAIMYHIAAGHLPQFPGKDQLSEMGFDFLRQCLQQDPNKRSSAAELLQDAWMLDIRAKAFSDGTSSSASDDRNEILQ
jgi:mitogen-activated protein kinase kinase kinase